jgi:hypothetical protein
VPGVVPAVSGTRWICARLDRLVFDHVVPGDFRVSMKFSARRPGIAATPNVEREKAAGVERRESSG